MNPETLRDTIALLRDCAAMDDCGLALLVRRTTPYSRLGRAARAVERRRDAIASVNRDLREMEV